MRLNRQALMDARDRAMFEHKRRHDEDEAKREAEREAERQDRLAKWRRAYADAWANAALEIRKVIRRGGAVTREMLPTDDYRHTATLHTSGTPRDYHAPAELMALRKVLATVTDDTVSMNSLERLGIGRTTIRAAAQQLAAETVKDTA